MDRFPHRLKSGYQTELPSHFIFFDTETKERKIANNEVAHDLVLGQACYYRHLGRDNSHNAKWHSFTTADQFWPLIQRYARPKIKLYLIAHNITFDLTILKGFSTLKRLGWDITSFYTASQCTIVKLRRHGCTLVMLDNLNFFKLSLAKLGEEIGEYKAQVDFDNVSLEDLAAYCKQDVNVMLRAWINYLNYLKDNDLGTFGVTIPSQAFSSFRHRFMKTEIFIHTNTWALQTERAAYYGGRTECFKLGKIKETPIYVVDVNSMYPYVMATEKYPVRLKKFIYKATLKNLKKALASSLVVAHVKVKITDPIVPKRQNDRIIFPIGTFWTVLTTPELQEVAKRGEILAVKTICLYDKASVFKPYVKFFYDAKAKAKKTGINSEILFTKLMLNSLYGKFGQRASSWDLVGTAPLDKCGTEHIFDAVTGKWINQYTFAGNIFEINFESESTESFPAIAAHVTAYARLYLYKLMEAAGRSNVYYCDTDSLFTNKEGYNRLREWLDATRLGALSLQKTAEELIIYCPKDYKLDSDIKIKGIRKTAKQIGPTTYQQEQWLSLRSLVARGNIDEYVVKTITKTLSREYKKGDVQPDGSITPYLLAE